MQFALNYSPAAGRLFDSGLISLDRFKCPDFPDMIAAASIHCPVYVHFSLDAGTGADYDLPQVDVLRRDTKTQYVNCHLNVRRPNFPDLPGDGGHTAADLTKLIDRLSADVRRLCDRFGPENVMAENLIYQGPPPAGEAGGHEGFLLPGVLPEVITQVIRNTGCGLLLDTSHARIAAHYMGLDAHQYIDSLPVDRLGELHVTGLKLHDGYLKDHFELSEEDLAFYQWSLARIRAGHWAEPSIVAFEYGGTGPAFAYRTDPGVIAGQVPMLYDLLHGT